MGVSRVFGGSPIGWRKIVRNQAKTLPKIFLWRGHFGPILRRRSLFLRRTIFRKPVEPADSYPQSFGYFWIKSSSWRPVGPTEKNKREKGIFFDWLDSGSSPE